MWQSGCVLFLAPEMIQNSIDDVLVLNASDDSGGTTAATANLNACVEYSLESLGPGQQF